MTWHDPGISLDKLQTPLTNSLQPRLPTTTHLCETSEQIGIVSVTSESQHQPSNWHEQALSVDVTLIVESDPKDYDAAMSRLPAEVIYWTNSQTFGECESFPNQIHIHL